MSRKIKVLCFMLALTGAGCTKSQSSDATITSTKVGGSALSPQELRVGTYDNHDVNALDFRSTLAAGGSGEFHFRPVQSGTIYLQQTSTVGINCDVQSLPITFRWATKVGNLDLNFPATIAVTVGSDYILTAAIAPSSCEGLYWGFDAYWKN